MYSYPYTDKDTFTKEYFVHKRDSVMQVNIPGFKEGVYMSTDSLLTDVRPISVHNDYTMEARGLWRMKGDFMGGPFVSHTRLDQKNQRIITAEIFVYSPDKMKRNLVRQMESSLYTLRLPQEAPQSQIPLGVTKEAEPTKNKNMEENKIRIGITQGDINGVGYEVILKTFSDPTMLELCTPIIYGSPKVAAYHRKALDVQANFSIVNTASEAGYNRLSVVNCTDDEVKVEFSKPDPEAGKAALGALERAIEEYREGLIDVIVTAPINKHTIQSEEFSFPGHTEYIEERLGNGNKSLMILMKNDFRVALVTTHIPVREIATTITKELIQEKLAIFHHCLKQDFGIGAPRIAVLSLNPHAGDGGLLGMEEQEVIIPAMKEMEEKGIICYGPYAADGFMGSGNYTHFDGILAMYHDQGLAPFKALAMEDGVNYTAGLPVVRTSPAHGTAYDIAGKGLASEDSFRQAIYVAIDVFRNRQREKAARVNPLRKQYYEKRDDSDKLKLDTVDED